MDTTILTTQQIIAPPAPTGLEAAVGNAPLLPLRRVTADISPNVAVLVKAEQIVLVAAFVGSALGFSRADGRSVRDGAR